MASESSGSAPKRTTQEILAMARAEAAKKAGGGVVAPAAAVPAAPLASEGEPLSGATAAGQAVPTANPSPAAPSPAPAAGKPKSTADILAAARAGKTGSPPAAGSSSAAPPIAPAGTKPAATPKSTADILAAARSGKGTAAISAAPAEKPPAKPKAADGPAAAAVAGVDGPKLSVEEMLAAVRPSTARAEPGRSDAASVKTETVVAVPKIAPPAPVRPSQAAGTKPATGKSAASKATAGDRRGFLAAALLFLCSPFVIAWSLFTATAGVWTLGLARFMLPNVLTEPPSKFKIGPPTDYDLGTVATKWVAQFGIWIVHTDQYRGRNLIYALASVCTHLGCTPSWLEGERKFKCPCHGSGFYITGINFEGPAPRPLERVGISLAADGMLQVDKSVKFQEEMGQWNDGTSFFEVTG